MASAEAMAAITPYADGMPRGAAAIAEDLDQFSALLLKWNRVQNLVSRETLGNLWSRHIVDSLQVLKLLHGDACILDLGSGGGFPAIPLAVALKGGSSRFMLVESNARKASFLRTVARELGLSATIRAQRSEEIDSRETIQADVITSRALAPLEQLCRMAAPFFGPRTRAIFHKGREHVEELVYSSALWHYDVLITKSDTDADGVLLELRNLRLKSS